MFTEKKIILDESVIFIRTPSETECWRVRTIALDWRKDWFWWRNETDVKIAIAWDEIIWMAWEVCPPGDLHLHVVEWVWINPAYRWRCLGLRLVEAVFTSSTSPIMYLDCSPSLSCYYRRVWFTEVDRALVTPDYLDERDPPNQVVMARIR